MSAVLLRRVHDFGGDEAVAELMQRAGSTRTAAELLEIANWISYDEAIALWRCGAEVTHHPQFARAVGEDSARRLNDSPVAALLRSLGSPENVYGQIATTATKYSTVVVLQARDCEPGRAEIIATAVPGFPRNAHHCTWTVGLLSQPTILFGLAPATVRHDECAAFGAPACVYDVSWETEPGAMDADRSGQIGQLTEQLDAMKRRLHSMFQTAGDLIGAGELDEVLARIADRAAVEIRAPRHLLAVRVGEPARLYCHHTGFAPDEVAGVVDRLDSPPGGLPPTWLAVPVRSNRRDYGHLLAVAEDGHRFFPQERELLDVYARYAASALDGATALMEAERRNAQSSALLELARAVAAAGTSVEIARRLADAVPLVVDCDQVGVYLWDTARGELVRQAITGVRDGELSIVPGQARWTPAPGGAVEQLVRDPNPTPLFMDGSDGQPPISSIFAGLGFAATILVPLVAPGQFLGLLTVSVRERPERLAPGPDLLDRLSGVAAQATTALQNGRLVDVITHQALHDQLTGLANRLRFAGELRDAVDRARDGGGLAVLFYIDLDNFKPVNDELGHASGDALLVAVAQRLRSCTRATDVVARLGGDEFAAVIVADSTVQIDAVAARIRGSFAEQFVIGGRRLQLGASVGQAVYPLDARDADRLLRHADEAMFADKRGRRSPSSGARVARLSA